MPKKYKPYTPSRRHMTGYDFSNLSKIEPLKKLTGGFKRSYGRNNQGRITTRHKGGGEKRGLKTTLLPSILHQQIYYQKDEKIRKPT